MALATVAVTPDADAYELRFNDGRNPACTACWVAPASERTYVADFGGFMQQVICERDLKDGTMRLRGLEATGTVEKDVLTLKVTRKDFEGTYRFKGGRLKSFSRPGAASSEAAERVRARLTSSVSPEALQNALWRRRKPDTRCRYWDNCNDRLRLWFENPNEAGALLALLALLLLGCALSLRGIWRLLAILLTPAPFFAILQTESRGAVLSFALGAVAMIACWCWRRRDVRRICLYGLSVVFAVGIVYLLFHGKVRCICRLLELDAGNSMRLDMWLAAPRMMVCAPLGWWAKVGPIYCEWFQSLEINQVFWTLNNTHLTVMVWGGFIVSFIYIWLWVEILRSLTAEALLRGRILALGQWVALAVAIWFSPIGLYHPDTLVIPGIMLVLHVWRLVSERRFSPKGIGGSALVAACMLLSVAVAGWLLPGNASGSHLVARKSFGIQLGRGEPKTWIVNDGLVLSGGTCGVLGKELRAFLRQCPVKGTLAVVDSIDAVPARVEKVILTGLACSEYVRRYRDGESVPEARQLYFLSPNLQPSEIPFELTDGDKLKVIAGEFLVLTWGRIAFVPSWLTIVPETALYIPDWKERVGL